MLQFVVPKDKIIKVDNIIIGFDVKYESFEIFVQNILYIERIDKDYRKIVFSTPLVLDDIKYFEAKWKTRDSINSIISELNFDADSNKKCPFFQKISSKVIARTIFFSGRDSEWKHLQLTGVNYLDQTYKPIELEIGRDFLPEIKKVFIHFFTLKVSNSFKGDSPDIILINPVDIIYIESKKRSKTIHLSKPFIKSNKSCYELNWNTILSANEIMKRLTGLMIQVNKNTLVGLLHINNSDSFLTSNQIELRLHDNKSIKTFTISNVFFDTI